MVQWENEISFVKRVEFAASPSGDGSGGVPFTMYFKEHWYDQFDTFKIDESRQQCIVLSVPLRKADDFWEYTVQLIDADFSASLDVDACAKDKTTRFLSNIQPEYSEKGYTKYMSNYEKHRQWLTEHRCDINYSSRYAAMEDKFLKLANVKDKEVDEAYFKLNPMEKDVLDGIKYVKNEHLLWGKTTMDANGKSTVKTNDGRQLIAGDGLVPQIERFASKFQYAKLNINVIQTVMSQMNQKAAEQIGNNYFFVTNNTLWSDIQSSLGDWLKQWGSAPTTVYSNASKPGGGQFAKIENANTVGATFVSYIYGGNTITFTVDTALTKEFPNKGFGICLDMSPDMTTNNPAVAGFTLEGRELLINKVVGVGGIDGRSSGVVSSLTAGSSIVATAVSGIAAFKPYASFILEQA